MTPFSAPAHVALAGIGATALMDLWLLLLARLGAPGTGFALVGRWVGHFARGRFAHAAVAKADPIPFGNGLRNLANHRVLGAGLYTAAAALAAHAA